MMMLGPVLMVQALSSCSLIDEPEYDDVDSSVKASLAFTVSNSSVTKTRMVDAVVQKGGSFRGLQSLRAIPFAISANATAVTTSDLAKVFEPEGYDSPYEGKNNDVPAPASSATPNSKASFYYFEKCSFMSGVNAFLAYANATAATYTGTNAYCSNMGINNKLYNGSLNATIPLRGNPTEINFAPEQIVTSTDAPSDGATIATYLTSIANTTGWSTSSNSELHAYFLNFIGQGNEGTMVMASSTANVEKHVGALRTQISGLTDLGTDDADIKTAIIYAIDAGYDATTGKLKTGYPANYPASIGLPAGAAAVRWNGSAFEVQTQTTTLANINTVTRFAYPAELYYYANSRIWTSNSEVTKDNYTSATNWGALLADKYEYENGTVSTNTKAAAIKDPLQYAVGRFDVKLNACSTPLKDANDKDVAIGPYTFPLTGIIVGSQRPASFDFTPTAESNGTYSDVNVRFIYDAYPTGDVYPTGDAPPTDPTKYLYLNTTGSGDKVASTLVLQTPDGEEVTVILEFLNNGTQTFRGKDGVVYPGTKFYLIGKLTADKNEMTDYKKRVFTRDYITLAPMSVNLLANAYNVIPDILSARLEVGIEIADWIAATPTSVPLN
jgi:hypothetical protein